MSPNYAVYSLPIIAALIGWGTNYLAVKMLFRPRRPKNLIFLKIQGVFPKRQAALAEKLGVLVARELISAEDILKKLKDKSGASSLEKMLGPKLDKVIREDLPQELPMLAMFLTPEVVEKVRGVFGKVLSPIVDETFNKLSQQVDQQLNIEEEVRLKVANFSSEKLEALILEVMKKELRFVEFFGAVLGFIIGMAQVFVLCWV